MDFGIAFPPRADSWRLVKRAEELGFTHAWFYDTQMLSADCFVAMAAAAAHTDRIALGTGVLVPSNRIAPVTASALATLNALAPGRIHFGVGTGSTARRAMGFPPQGVDTVATYVRQVQGLLQGDTVEFQMEGQTRKIRLLNPELGHINIDDPVAVHVSAFGPRTRSLVAALGAGWITFVSPLTDEVEELTAMRSAWCDAGHPVSSLQATAFAQGCVLEEGEPATSPRAMAQAGPRAAMMLHQAADTSWSHSANTGFTPELKASIEGYAELARSFEPADTRYLQIHSGHLMFVKPEERPFITDALVRAASFTGTESELMEHVEALRSAGYTQFTIHVTPGQEAALLDWHRICRSFLSSGM